MIVPINLADPDFEPSDEDLEGLMRRAFAGVRDEHEQALSTLRGKIAEAEAEALLRFFGPEEAT